MAWRRETPKKPIVQMDISTTKKTRCAIFIEEVGVGTVGSVVEKELFAVIMQKRRNGGRDDSVPRT
jgi:hypothetical protein